MKKEHWQKEKRPASLLAPHLCESNSVVLSGPFVFLNEAFLFFFSSLHSSQLSSLVLGLISRGAVVSERFLHVLNPFISLCPGKKYIRMKLKRPTGAETRDDTSLSQTSGTDKIGLFLF